MILTVTMNPSVDIAYPLKKLIIDGINRVDNINKTAGGKGLNVARVIKLSGYSVNATGFLGGRLGEYIKNELDKDRVSHDFYAITAESRNCIAILHEHYQTEILESGPTITTEEQRAFKTHFSHLLNTADIITLSGSLPKGIGDDYYAKLIDIANQQKKTILLDTSGNALKKALDSVPYLIKPNCEELGQLVGKTLDAADDYALIAAINSKKKLTAIPVIVVSLGKMGALVKYKQRFLKVRIPTISAVNPVGAGDSTLAGLAIGLNQKENIEEILKRAMTLGMLNTMEALTGYVNLQNYDQLFKQVNVVEL